MAKGREEVQGQCITAGVLQHRVLNPILASTMAMAKGGTRDEPRVPSPRRKARPLQHRCVQAQP